MDIVFCQMKRLVMLLGFGLLAGCATPDLKPFATETAALGSAISGEQAEVQARLAAVTARAQSRDPEDPRLEAMNRDQARYASDAAAIDAVLAVAVNYSSTLAELAARGETGQESVDSLAQSLQGLASAVGAVLPGPNIPEWTVKLIREVGADVTRVQAQQSLAAATRAADPAVQRMAAAIAQIYAWPNGPHAKIITGLQIKEEGVLRDEVGKNRLAFYRSVNVNNVTVAGRSPQTRLEYFFGDVDDRIGRQNPAGGICGLTRPVAASGALEMVKDDPHCLTGQTAQGLVAMTSLLAGIEPQFQAYTRSVTDSKLWAQQRASIDAQVAAAALAWAREHQSIMNRLESCGGLHALRQGCGNLTFANLKLFVGRVKAISEKGESDAQR